MQQQKTTRIEYKSSEILKLLGVTATVTKFSVAPKKTEDGERKLIIEYEE